MKTLVIDTISEPGSWQRAFDRGCLTPLNQIDHHPVHQHAKSEGLTIGNHGAAFTSRERHDHD